jgi:hypothetical protein
MRATTDRKSPDGPARGIASAPRKRFQIEKLEERIAPKKGGKGTNNCSYGSGIY